MASVVFSGVQCRQWYTVAFSGVLCVFDATLNNKLALYNSVLRSRSQ